MAKLEIELSTEEEACVLRNAQAEGLALSEYARQRLLGNGTNSAEHSGLDTDHASTQNGSAPILIAKNAAAIAMLDEWLAEDATDDPELIRKATEEYEELKRNLNANRIAAGESLVFP